MKCVINRDKLLEGLSIDFSSTNNSSHTAITDYSNKALNKALNEL